MNDEESFLARWSRRKRGTAAKALAESAAQQPASGMEADALAAASSAEEILPPVDPAGLPAIESIGPGSDIQVFLAPGVPRDLARAALRRAWSTDPTIRDFVGLSENAWDFNAPGGVPGFGAISSEEVRRLMAHMSGEAEEVEPQGPAPKPQSETLVETPKRGSAASGDPPGNERAEESPDSGQNVHDAERASNTRIAAMQHDSAEAEYFPATIRRRHGGALPE
ncbi:MAG TPA: DUF3306 domain-containing protein [Candidatus Cybelea sp.]|nr:DUF3306 domain-containing protein [Candidatus Cybelea sp.]